MFLLIPSLPRISRSLSWLFFFFRVRIEVVTSLPTSSRSSFFQSRDSLQRKGKGHGGKVRHWKQDEFGSHGKSLEESRTGIRRKEKDGD